MSDEGRLPRVRALVLDARRDPGSPMPLGRVGAVATGNEHRIALAGARVVVSGRFSVHLEHVRADSSTRERVQRARGVDVALVIAGQKNGVASRDLKVLHACGCRRAVLLVPPGVPDVVVENLGRHLLLGARYEGDEMPVVPLASAPEACTATDIATILDAIDRIAQPTQPGALLATGTWGSGGAHVEVASGAIFDGDEVWVHQRGALVGTKRAEVPSALYAGDDGEIEVMWPATGEAMLAHEELSWITEFAVEGLRVDEVPELCFAFGGRGGFADGRIVDGRVHLSEGVSPLDGRVGLVRFQGAGLGPVQSVTVLS